MNIGRAAVVEGVRRSLSDLLIYRLLVQCQPRVKKRQNSPRPVWSLTAWLNMMERQYQIEIAY
jgi:hypothetical protein